MTVTSYTVSEPSIRYQEVNEFGEGGDIVQNGTRVLNSPKTFYLYLDRKVDGDVLNGIYSVQDDEYVSYFGITNPDFAKVFTFTGQDSFVASSSSCGERCTVRNVVIPRGIITPYSKCTKDFPELTCESSLSSFSSARISQQRDNSYVSFFDRFVPKNMIYENLIKIPGLPY
jgi:hypothetical protein